MEDDPRAPTDFESRFPSEAACVEHLAQIRWPDGFVCPTCDGRKAWKTGRLLLHCAGCGHQFSLTAGTIFHGTRKPLRTWYQAMWSVTSRSEGANAKRLQRDLGLGSYRTAWAWLHKLRRAMVSPSLDRLGGVVHFGIGRVGGCKTNRGLAGGTLVFIAAEGRRGKLQRTRTVAANGTSEARLHEFVRALTNSDAILHAGGIRPIEQHLNDWLRGTYSAGVSPNHLPYYLDEFTFRFNHRILTRPKQLFGLLVKRATTTDPAPYGKLIKPK